MKKLCLALVLLACSTFSLAENRPTDASVRELLQVMQTQKLLDSQMAQMDKMLDAYLSPAMAGGKISPDQQQALETLKGKYTALVKAEMGWSTMEPLMTEVYAKSFNQSEIDSMLAFYKSPVGQSVVAKMPAVMQNAALVVQERTKVILPKIQKLMQESLQLMRKPQ